MLKEEVVSSEEQVDDTTPESQTEPTEQESTSDETGENQSNTAEEETEEAKTVPYERFKEVIDSNRELKEKFEQLAPALENLQPDSEQGASEEFETVEDLLAYVNKQNEQTWQEREKALEEKFTNMLQAQSKLNELKTEFPEEMKDPQFRNFVLSSMKDNPNADVLDTAKNVKKYLDEIAEKGRKAAKEELIQKGGFKGKAEGNQPHRSKEDDKLVEDIVNAGGKSDSIF